MNAKISESLVYFIISKFYCNNYKYVLRTDIVLQLNPLLGRLKAYVEVQLKAQRHAYLTS